MNEKITIGGREITVRQMTMADVRRFVAEMQQQADGQEPEPHVIDMLFDDPVPASAVSVATGLSLDELAGDFTQSEMRELLDAVKAANPFFVGMMERLVEAGRQLSAT